jgi:hypothetical protein
VPHSIYRCAVSWNKFHAFVGKSGSFFIPSQP